MYGGDNEYAKTVADKDGIFDNRDRSSNSAAWLQIHRAQFVLALVDTFEKILELEKGHRSFPTDEGDGEVGEFEDGQEGQGQNGQSQTTSRLGVIPPISSPDYLFFPQGGPFNLIGILRRFFRTPPLWARTYRFVAIFLRLLLIYDRVNTDSRRFRNDNNNNSNNNSNNTPTISLTQAFIDLDVAFVATHPNYGWPANQDINALHALVNLNDQATDPTTRDALLQAYAQLNIRPYKVKGGSDSGSESDSENGAEK